MAKSRGTCPRRQPGGAPSTRRFFSVGKAGGVTALPCRLTFVANLLQRVSLAIRSPGRVTQRVRPFHIPSKTPGIRVDVAARQLAT